MTWKSDFAGIARRTLIDVDDLADAAWRRFAKRMGFDKPRQIIAYRGYGNSERVWVHGRLLANELYGGPEEDDTWWDNLRASYERWQSREVPGAEIILRYRDAEEIVVTDDEGYYKASFANVSEAAQQTVSASHEASDETLIAAHEVFCPPTCPNFALISDVDDTVIHTHITDLLIAARLTFLNNAKTRKPLAGAAELYRSLARSGTRDGGRNPIFYLSNSGWNLYDLLRDFLDLNDFPPGPILLRDLGISTDTSTHKIETLKDLMTRLAPLPVILVGDSGQHDAEIYAEIAREHPDRVKAIYIRDVDPGAMSDHDCKVDRIIASLGDRSISITRATTSADIARHAAELGLLAPDTVQFVEDSVQKDLHRDVA